MMRILCALLATTGLVQAADLGPRTQPERPPITKTYAAPSSSPTWTGLYVGAHGGFGWGSFQDVSNASASEQETDGGFGGVQIGYNQQLGNLVLGIEADVSFGSIGNDWLGHETSGSPWDPYYGSDKTEMFGTVRGRLGYAFGGFLPYVTGGLLWSQNKHSLGCSNAVAPNNFSLGCEQRAGAFNVSEEKFSFGWVVGGGVEVALGANWTIKAEYLYGTTDTGEIDLLDPNYPASTTRDFEGHVHLARGGLNYRF